MSVLDALVEDPVGWTVALAALLAAVAYLGKVTRASVRWFRAVGRTVNVIEGVVQRELDHNHGSSIKDDVYGIARAVGVLGRTVDDLTDQITDVDNRLTSHLQAREAGVIAAELTEARHRRDNGRANE